MTYPGECPCTSPWRPPQNFPCNVIHFLEKRKISEDAHARQSNNNLDDRDGAIEANRTPPLLSRSESWLSREPGVVLGRTDFVGVNDERDGGE